MNPMRRDSAIKPPPGTVIAEFANGEDALLFARLKGRGFYISAGINLVFAVRTALESTPAVSPGPGRAPATPNPLGVAGRFELTALTERGREMLPLLREQLAELTPEDE